MAGDKPPAPAASGAANTASVERYRAARLAAVQGLYQMELTGVRPPMILFEFGLRGMVPELDAKEIDIQGLEMDQSRFERLVRGVAEQRESLDAQLVTALPEDWPLDRLDSVMRAILRAGIFELLHFSEVPGRVVIDEYVDIAHAFFGGKEPAMINGVLDSLAHKVRKAEFSASSNGG
ncbi:MAG: transcription antitermination factor NusB [Alphaproteobacteria bacterium]